MVDLVSEKLRIDWFSVYKQPVVLFLNIYSYIVSLNAEEQRSLQTWKATH